MAEPDYYEVLQVARDAPRDEVKARYRQAVRQHHPDAAPPGLKEAAHARIQLINAAWTVLGSPAARSAYDERVRRSQVQGQAGAAEAPRGGVAARGEREAGHEPGDARKRSRVQAVMGGTSPPRVANPRTRLLAMVFDAAQMYHVEGRPEEAARICQQVLRADPTNAEAAVLLADIYAAQSQRAAALDLLERAVRLQPSNALYRSKLEALRQLANSPAAPPATEPRARGAAPNPWSKAPAAAPLASRLSERPAAQPAPGRQAAPEAAQGSGEESGPPDAPWARASQGGVEGVPSALASGGTPVAEEGRHEGEEASRRASVLQRLRSKLAR